MNTRPSIAQPLHPVQDASAKQKTKQKYKPHHQQTGLPPHSALPIRGKTNKQKTQHKSHSVLVPQPGMEPIFLAVEAWKPNHWTSS